MLALIAFIISATVMYSGEPPTTVLEWILFSIIVLGCTLAGWLMDASFSSGRKGKAS